MPSMRRCLNSCWRGPAPCIEGCTGRRHSVSASSRRQSAQGRVGRLKRQRRSPWDLTALLNADADALALDAYPLEELRRVLSALLSTKAPSADSSGPLPRATG